MKNRVILSLLLAVPVLFGQAHAAEPCVPGRMCLTASANQPTPQVGDEVTFEFTAINDRADAVSDIAVDTDLGSGLSFVSSVPAQGSYDPATGLWSVGSMAVGSTATLAITATVLPTDVPYNARAASESDPQPAALIPGTLLDYHASGELTNPADAADTDTDTVTLAPVSADVQGNIAGSGTPELGETYTLVIEAVNHGPAAASNVALTHTMQPGFTYVSSSATQGSYNVGTGLWTIGAMPASSVVTLSVVVTVEPMGPHRSEISVSADQHDPNTGNNTNGMVIYPGSPDFQLTKSVDNSTPLVGELVTFTVEAFNAGPGLGPNTVVRDPLQAGFEYVSHNASIGSYGHEQGVWSIGNLVPYTPVTLTITARVLGDGPFGNVAWIEDATIFRDGFEDQPEPPTESTAVAEVTVFPTSTRLSVAKSVDNPNANVGDEVTFTVEASNAGPGNATGVVVTDQLEAGFTYVSSSATQGSYNAATGLWTIGALPAHATVTLTITATVNPTGPYHNNVSIGGNEHDPDDDDNDDGVIVTPGSADLSVSKSVDNPNAQVGDVVTFTVLASNAGPASATGVVVTDQLEGGFTYVSSSATQGGYNPGTGLWTIGGLPVGSTATLTITATVNPTGPYHNSVSIGGNEHDPTPDDDDDDVVVTPGSADLTVVKTANTMNPRVGDQVTFMILAGNNGPATATGVVVTDQLEAGFSYVSSSADQGSYDPGTGLWTIGGLPVGDSVLLSITATVNPTGPYHNVAAINGDQHDPDGDDPDNEVVINPNVPPTQPVMVPMNGPGALLVLLALLAVTAVIAIPYNPAPQPKR